MLAKGIIPNDPLRMTGNDNAAYVLGELAMVTATLAAELHRQGLLAEAATKMIAGSLDRMAARIETHDPLDPDELTQIAAGLHSVALLLRQHKP